MIFAGMHSKTNIHHCNFCNSKAHERFLEMNSYTRNFNSRINDISYCNIINNTGRFIKSDDVYIRLCNIVDNSDLYIDAPHVYIKCYFENNTLRKFSDEQLIFIDNQSYSVSYSYSLNNWPKIFMKDEKKEKTCIDDEIIAKSLFGVLPLMSLR